MKKFIIKFFLALSLFISFGSTSFAIIKNPTEIRNQIVNCIVKEFAKEFDITECVNNNIPGSIDDFVEGIDLLQVFSRDSYETIQRRFQFIQKFHLDELAPLLSIGLNNCIDSLLKECNEKIVRQVLNKPNINGITLLALAVSKGYWEMSLELLRNGACGFVTDSSGMIIDCVLFDQDSPVLNKRIPVELFGKFKECLIGEISFRALVFDRARMILSRKRLSRITSSFKSN